MKKLMICLLALPLALSGCVSDDEMAVSRAAYPESAASRYMDEIQRRESIEGFNNSLAVAVAAFGR